MIPKNKPTHPGKFVKEDILKELGITQTQLANALGVPRHTITQLVNEKISQRIWHYGSVDLPKPRLKCG